MSRMRADVLAAINRARDFDLNSWGPDFYVARDSHCDDLRATAERHTNIYEDDSLGAYCVCCRFRWPCPDYQQVIDRLTGWGVL